MPTGSPTTGWAEPDSRRATLSTAVSLVAATSRYRPSGVSASPRPCWPPGSETDFTVAGAAAPARSTVTPRLSLTKTHRPSGDVITPNGAGGTDVITGLTPVSVRAGATAPLHPGTFNDLAGTVRGKGDAAAGGRPGGATAADGPGGRAVRSAGVHEASNARAPDAAPTASVRASAVFIASA